MHDKMEQLEGVSATSIYYQLLSEKFHLEGPNFL